MSLPKALIAKLKEINKKSPGTVIVGDSPVLNVDVIPTGIASFDIALGVGGLPRGRIIELFGVESSGKTTTTLQIIAECQRTHMKRKNRKGVAAFIDAEHALDPTWAKTIGVNMDELLVSQPSSGDEAFTLVKQLAETGDIDLIVVDSVAALVPQEELEGDISDVQIGAHARLISKGLRMINGVISDNDTVIVFINQIRNKVGQMFGNPETTPGGLALKFWSSVRIDMRQGTKINPSGKKDENSGRVSGGEVTGITTKIKIIKNKVARPFTSCEYDIDFKHGVDVVGSVFDAIVDKKIIEIRGSNYYYNCDIDKGKQKLLGNGYDKALAALRANSELVATMRQKLMAAIAKDAVPLDPSNPEALANALTGDEETEAPDAEEVEQHVEEGDEAELAAKE